MLAWNLEKKNQQMTSLTRFRKTRTFHSDYDLGCWDDVAKDVADNSIQSWDPEMSSITTWYTDLWQKHSSLPGVSGALTRRMWMMWIQHIYRRKKTYSQNVSNSQRPGLLYECLLDISFFFFQTKTAWSSNNFITKIDHEKFRQHVISLGHNVNWFSLTKKRNFAPSKTTLGTTTSQVQSSRCTEPDKNANDMR